LSSFGEHTLPEIGWTFNSNETHPNEDAARAFAAGKDGYLSWHYGLEITKLVMAAYMAAERRQTIDLTDPAIQEELKTFVPLIQQGRGAEVLHVL
jgi:hypothetical protein